MIDPIPLLLIALVSLAIGFGLGTLFAGVRKKSSESQGAAPETEPDRYASSHLAVNSPQLPPDSSRPAPEAARLDLNPVNLLARALQSEGTLPSPAPKSIAAQVDEILQEKLADLPPEQFPAEKRAIRLVDTPGKGVSVMIGLDLYDGVEAVPDAWIRDLIHQAVKDWETQAYPFGNSLSKD